MNDDESPFKYSNFLTLEFNGRDLSSFIGTGRQIGLKNGSEIFIKIKPDFYKELAHFLKFL